MGRIGEAGFEKFIVGVMDVFLGHGLGSGAGFLKGREGQIIEELQKREEVAIQDCQGFLTKGKFGFISSPKMEIQLKAKCARPNPATWCRKFRPG